MTERWGMYGDMALEKRPCENPRDKNLYMQDITVKGKDKEKRVSLTKCNPTRDVTMHSELVENQ